MDKLQKFYGGEIETVCWAYGIGLFGGGVVASGRVILRA